MAGAPTKYSRARAEKIYAAVRLGQPLDRAATAGGIDRGTLRLWREHNPAFSTGLDAAIAEGEREVVACLRVAAKEGSVAAMLGWLERRFPDDWSRGERVKQEHSGEVNVNHIIREMQASADAALPEDAQARRRFAQELMARDTTTQGEETK